MKKGAILLIAGVGALLVYLGVSTAQNKFREWANKIKVSITGIGKPTLASNAVNVPIKLRVSNPAPIAIPVSNFIVNVIVIKGTEAIKIAAGKPTGPVTLNPGNTDLQITPVIDFNALKNILPINELVGEIQNIFTGAASVIQLRFDAIATVGGIDIPVSYNYSLNLSNL